MMVASVQLMVVIVQLVVGTMKLIAVITMLVLMIPAIMLVVANIPLSPAMTTMPVLLTLVTRRQDVNIQLSNVMIMTLVPKILVILLLDANMLH